MHQALESLVEALEQEPSRSLRTLEVMPENERQQVLYEWNATETEYPRERCVHELIEEQVEKIPEAVAVVFEDEVLSYGDLNRRANQLAHYLRGLGVGPDVRVGICLERGLEMMVGLLGVLKAGGAYVPLDPAYPQERLQYMLADSAPAVLLTQAGLQELFSGVGQGLPVVDLDFSAPPWRDQPATNPDHVWVGLKPDHSAYVIYTSGSTGQPKGVMNTHKGILNRLQWMQEAYDLTPDDKVIQKTPFSFDVSVWEFFWPLMNGATLVLARPEGHKDPTYLIDVINSQQVTTLHFVPSMLQIFLEEEGSESCRSIKRVICSGEALPLALQQHFFSSSKAELHNLYGPTEASVDVTFWRCAPAKELETVPIGRPIANMQIFLLDQHMMTVPIGVAGELHIGGVGLARGYLGRAELTAQQFVSNPFAKEHGARMYRTGDLARWLADGTVEFLGRVDHQVKVRGYRIELGEIEARLVEHEAVREAVVMAREESAGDKRLVAYYTSVSGAIGTEELRRHLSALLPEYMVPAAYVHLEQLPLTPNGKLDRKALPAPDGEAYAVRGYEEPVGEIETAIASIWMELLKLERVGRYDNFFELGGHSLLAVRLISRLRKNLKIEVMMADLFAHPSLAALAERIINLQLEQLDPDKLEYLLNLMRGA
jgi:amino acid adenylation domain-containing protein